VNSLERDANERAALRWRAMAALVQSFAARVARFRPEAPLFARSRAITDSSAPLSLAQVEALDAAARETCDAALAFTPSQAAPRELTLADVIAKAWLLAPIHDAAVLVCAEAA
jgi:hypothetical protein